MFKKINQVTFCLCTSLLIGSTAYAQQGFGTDTPSKASAIEMKSTNKGLLIPRIVLQSLTSFAPLAGENSLNIEKSNSLLIYNTESVVSENIDPGYYYWTTDGTTGSWKRLLADDDASALALADGTISSGANGAITVTNGDNATFKDVTLAVKADNGTTVANDHVQLGGALNKPTTITITSVEGATPDNTLAIENLPQGSTIDKIVVADPATGVLKQVNAAMPTFFYMPSIVFDISTAGTFQRNLHSIYIDQFTNPPVVSEGATQGIPTLPANQLEYYVTYYDTDVFNIHGIDANGILHYTVLSTSATAASFMNIVFVVKNN